jgi:antitoxin VapB
MKTRAFKSGNSQAVRIPADIAYADTDTELEITRNGDVITIQPAAGSIRSMQEALEILRRMPKTEPIGPLERTQTRETLWD